MTRRFDGAITTPEEALDSTSPPAAPRPARPASIELAAAILIVGGFTSVIETLGATLGFDPAAADPGARPVIALIMFLDVLTMIVGLLVRRGQAWVVCINVVAVVLFVELMAIPAGSATAVLLAVLDGFVFVALARNRAWFGWQPPTEIPAR